MMNLRVTTVCIHVEYSQSTQTVSCDMMNQAGSGSDQALVQSLQEQLRTANGINDKLLQRICQITEISKFREDFNQHAKTMVDFKEDIAKHMVREREVQQLKVENARLKKKISAGTQFAELHDLISSLKIGVNDNSTENQAVQSMDSQSLHTTNLKADEYPKITALSSHKQINRKSLHTIDDRANDDSKEDENGLIFGPLSNWSSSPEYCKKAGSTADGQNEQDSKEDDFADDEERKHDLNITLNGTAANDKGYHSQDSDNGVLDSHETFGGPNADRKSNGETADDALSKFDSSFAVMKEENETPSRWTFGMKDDDQEELENVIDDIRSDPSMTSGAVENQDEMERSLKIVDLKEVELSMGTEQETNLRTFPIHKLYRWGKDVVGDSGWKNRATETSIEFWQQSNDGKVRVICRENVTRKLRMNHFVAAPDIAKVTKKSDTFVQWNGLDDTIEAEDEDDGNGYCMFLCKFKDADTAQSFYDLLTSLSENNIEEADDESDEDEDCDAVDDKGVEFRFSFKMDDANTVSWTDEVKQIREENNGSLTTADSDGWSWKSTFDGFDTNTFNGAQTKKLG